MGDPMGDIDIPIIIGVATATCNATARSGTLHQQRNTDQAELAALPIAMARPSQAKPHARSQLSIELREVRCRSCLPIHVKPSFTIQPEAPVVGMPLQIVSITGASAPGWRC